MQYENVFKVIGGVQVILASLKSSSAAQTALKMASGTGTDAPPVAQRLLTIATPKQVHKIYIHANNSKNLETIQQYMKTANKTMLELFYALE